MEPFHAFLTITCRDCGEKLIRIAQSQHNDLAVCPRCLTAGTYDAVVEDHAELDTGFVFSDDLKHLIRTLHASRHP
ncbi:MAG TPA: hypothetical protein VHV26_02945 [Rhizomicrobium sp.]|jgi:phage FluMu protein Com|nr:hypothetical protein [Rhizomicrobium sp.]